MRRTQSMTLGATHHFLYPDSPRDARIHTESLAQMLDMPQLDAVDAWVWPDPTRAAREQAMLRGSGKRIHYNIGDRYGERPCRPASAEPEEREHALSIMRREIDYALGCGARTIVFASGADQMLDRASAVKRFQDFVLEIKAFIPQDVLLVLEPTDRDFDKRFLFGPVDESEQFVRACRHHGFDHLGLLLDMSHIPLMHTTMPDAVRQCRDVLGHVHLGNCVIRDPAHPLYGDKHVPWDYPGGEYGVAQVVDMLEQLIKHGYFEPQKRATVSFEMRPVVGKSPEDSLGWFIEVLDRAWEEAVCRDRS